MRRPREADGCAVAAYDLETGKRLWRTELEALGPVSHKQGFNHVQMESIDQVLVVRGWEEAGKYVEVLAFPGRGHGVSDPPARRVLMQRVMQFFLDNL